nr:hypothetical protein [uncultured Rhodopila sp.]
MTGDLYDFVARIRSAIPKRWFGDQAPNLTAIITCIATPWTWLYGLLTYVISQTRIGSASDNWLDLIALDFFGSDLARDSGENDTSYRSRIQRNLLRTAASRSAVSSCMEQLTGAEPRIFEPAKCSDTGSYATVADGPVPPGCGLAYGAAGGWGNLNLPFQFFITITRPPTPGVGLLAGYGTNAAGYDAGSIAYFDLSMLPGQVTDEDIQNTLSSLLPINTVAWLQIV